MNKTENWSFSIIRPPLDGRSSHPRFSHGLGHLQKYHPISATPKLM